MLRAAALVPPTALLVLPEAPRALDEVRSDARAVVAVLVRAAAERVVVVSPGSVQRISGVLHPTFRAAGIAVERSGLGSTVVGVPHHPSGRERTDTVARTPVAVDDVPAAVGLALLAGAGWTGPVEVVGVGGAGAEELRAAGRALAHDDVALLLVGGLSARRGPGAPLAEDQRAPDVDASIVTDLARLGRPGDPSATERLAALDPDLARALAISAFGPWQVLLGALGAAGPELRATVREGVPAGATYVTAAWARP